MDLHPPPRPMPPAGAPNLLGAPVPLLAKGAGAPAANKGRLSASAHQAARLTAGLWPVVSSKVLLMSNTQQAAVWPFSWPSRACSRCIPLADWAKNRRRQHSSANCAQVSKWK